MPPIQPSRLPASAPTYYHSVLRRQPLPAVRDTFEVGRVSPWGPTPLQAWQLPWAGSTAKPQSQALLKQARTAFAAEQFTVAHQQLSQALERDSTDPDTHFLRALTRLSLGDEAGAHSDFDAVLHELPYDARTHLSHGLMAYARHDYNQAWIAFTRVVAHFPGDPVAWIFRSCVNAHFGHSDLSARDAQTACGLLPQAVAPQIAQALEAFRLGRCEEARHCLSAIVVAYPYEPAIAVLNAQIITCLGNAHQALEIYRGILRDDPSNVSAGVLRAEALRQGV